MTLFEYWNIAAEVIGIGKTVALFAIVVLFFVVTLLSICLITKCLFENVIKIAEELRGER